MLVVLEGCVLYCSSNLPKEGLRMPEEDKLGRLIPVELREVWTKESSDFTPWLAQADSLKILGEALGIDLELEAQEKAVGPFRADILCKDIGTGAWVLVENQLERTNHRHLGQLLTYASGLDAATIVWIASEFTEEHRSTLDWLNKITAEGFSFFGLEVQLWKIDDSPNAPKFNIVSKPNDWSRSVARALNSSKLSDTQIMQQNYWESMHTELKRVSGPVSGNQKAQPQTWMDYSVGKTGFSVGAYMLRDQKRIRAQLYISHKKAKIFYKELIKQKKVIEENLGYPLEWEELPERIHSRISVYMENADPEDENDWPRQHEWLAKKINEFHKVFYVQLRNLE